MSVQLKHAPIQTTPPPINNITPRDIPIESAIRPAISFKYKMAEMPEEMRTIHVIMSIHITL